MDRVRCSSLRQIPAAAVLAAALAGCAAIPESTAVARDGVTWAGYLYGEDLRQGCGDQGPDRFRLVFNAALPGRTASIFEVTGHPDRGGSIEAWAPGMANVGELGPAAPVPVGGARQRLELTGDQFVALARRLIQAGALLPPHSQLNLGGSQLRWFATGCLDGRYFLSAYTYSPGTVADISLDPADLIPLP